MSKDVMIVTGAGQISMAIARRVGFGKKIVLGDKNPKNCETIAKIMTPIYERKFYPCSYGFRPGRSCLGGGTENSRERNERTGRCKEQEREETQNESRKVERTNPGREHRGQKGEQPVISRRGGSPCGNQKGFPCRLPRHGSPCRHGRKACTGGLWRPLERDVLLSDPRLYPLCPLSHSRPERSSDPGHRGDRALLLPRGGKEGPLDSSPPPCPVLPGRAGSKRSCNHRPCLLSPCPSHQCGTAEDADRRRHPGRTSGPVSRTPPLPLSGREPLPPVRQSAVGERSRAQRDTEGEKRRRRTIEEGA